MSRLDITDYGLSKDTGFLLEKPLTRLPPYFDPWNNVAHRFAELVGNKTIREEVEKLPVLDFTELKGTKEIKLGHLQLVSMTAGYLWLNGTDPSQVPKVLPACLAVPLYGMYEKYDLVPNVTYADILLNNVELIDSKRPIQYENVASIIDFACDKQDWESFVAIACMVEYEFAKGVPAIQNVLDGMDESDEEKITLALKEIAEVVRNMQATCKLYHEKFTTESFAKVVGFFQGFDELIFEGVKDEPVKMKGANAGQTSTLKVLDALLGIEHTKHRSYVEEIMKCIPPDHRNLIRTLRERPKQLKPIVEGSSNLDMKEAFKSVVDSVCKFRSYHVQLVAKFFIQAMKKTLPEEVNEQLRPLKEFTMEFIKGMRDDSKQASTT